MSFHLRILTLAVFFAAATAHAIEAKTGPGAIDDGITVRTGMMSYTFSGILSGSGTNAQNVDVAWDHYAKRNFATSVGYRIAYAEIAGRTLYQAANLGVKYYPMTLGAPVRGGTRFATVSYDFLWRPYLQAGGSIGDFLLRAEGKDKVRLISSEFYGIVLGGGSHWQLGERWAIDTGVIFEQLQSMSPIAFAATNIYALFGVLVYY